MTLLARLLGFLLPACGAAGAGGLPTPMLLDMTHIQRPASPNTALAGPAETDPAHDIVTLAFAVPALHLYEAVIAVALAQPRTFLAAAYPAERQVHFVARSAWLNFPDLITAQIGEAGRGQTPSCCIHAASMAIPTLAEPQRLQPGLPPCRPRSTTLTRK
jgi:hypothetical protein